MSRHLFGTISTNSPIRLGLIRDKLLQCNCLWTRLSAKNDYKNASVKVPMQAACHCDRPFSNLFLLLLLPELRQQGLTFIAVYALQRIITVPGISEYQLRRETGLEGYEMRLKPSRRARLTIRGLPRKRWRFERNCISCLGKRTLVTMTRRRLIN
jgi:hypothetical protein